MLYFLSLCNLMILPYFLSCPTHKRDDWERKNALTSQYGPETFSCPWRDPEATPDRLKDYIRIKDIPSHQRIFPILYEAAREMVTKAGSVVGIHLRPHDLRRHAATYASRFGVPIEIVSKVILRHLNLSTTERYLGKIRDVEALKWIDTLYA